MGKAKPKSNSGIEKFAEACDMLASHGFDSYELDLLVPCHCGADPCEPCIGLEHGIVHFGRDLLAFYLYNGILFSYRANPFACVPRGYGTLS